MLSMFAVAMLLNKLFFTEARQLS